MSRDKAAGLEGLAALFVKAFNPPPEKPSWFKSWGSTSKAAPKDSPKRKPPASWPADHVPWPHEPWPGGGSGYQDRPYQSWPGGDGRVR